MKNTALGSIVLMLQSTDSELREASNETEPKELIGYLKRARAQLNVIDMSIDRHIQVTKKQMLSSAVPKNTKKS